MAWYWRIKGVEGEAGVMAVSSLSARQEAL
jgi:hypothetical protein